MKSSLIVSLILLISTALEAQNQAYTIYNSKGKKTSYQKMRKSLVKSDVVLFGELHNNPIAHWLEYELSADLLTDRKLILGAEMLEADNQQVLNQYLLGSISYQALDSTARLWPNHRTDYAPLVDLAKTHGLPFIATNIPRRYARSVYQHGFEALDSLMPHELEWVAPLPMAFDPELPSYRNILTLMGDHGTPRLVMAQASKDATMAHFILKNYAKNHLFIHFNGAYHSDHYQGILWYLKRERADLKYRTLSTVSQQNIHHLLKENHGKADFIICVDSNMTTTY